MENIHAILHALTKVTDSTHGSLGEAFELGKLAGLPMVDSPKRQTTHTKYAGGRSNSHNEELDSLVVMDYPLSGEQEIFCIDKSKITKYGDYDPVDDLLRTIRVQHEEFNIPHPADTPKKRASKNIVKSASDLIKNLNSKLTLSALVLHSRTTPSDPLLFHILNQSYLRIMSDQNPKRLNTVPVARGKHLLYGELSPELVSLIVEKLSMRRQPPSVFIDFGSGIGNAVLQMASQTPVFKKCIGIEILEHPYGLSLSYKNEYIKRLVMYGYPELALDVQEKVSLLHGDFSDPSILTSPDIRLKEVDIVLVNNWTFPPHVNNSLLNIFLELKQGAKIVSLVNFVPLSKGQKENGTFSNKSKVYNSCNPKSILRVEAFSYGPEMVSWTSAPGAFYVHTVDRNICT